MQYVFLTFQSSVDVGSAEKESEQLAIASLTLLFDGKADSILLKQLQLSLDPNASAESLVQIPDLSHQDILNFENIMSAWHSENPVVAAEKELELRNSCVIFH